MKTTAKKLIEDNIKYLKAHFSASEIRLMESAAAEKTPNSQIKKFISLYHQLALEKRRGLYKNHTKTMTDKIINANHKELNILKGDCLAHMQQLSSELFHLIVTSPPYYNAREYSQWENIDLYLEDMEAIMTECYRVLRNHRYFVLNIGDISGNDGRVTKSSWGNRRLPLSAYFTVMMEKIGFSFVDDFIWDKGQVQSQRHKNPPYPLYSYPINCYEHILFFIKNEIDTLKYPCPVCGSLKINGNSCSRINVKSWECKNPECPQKSASFRGKRFSLRGIEMENLKTPQNKISQEILKEWRRDIVKINPVIKINSKGENKKFHTAPFPQEIPEYAIKILTGVNELVYDPFAGSLTTLIEANKYGRVGIGSEIDKTMLAKVIQAIKDDYKITLIK